MPKPKLENLFYTTTQVGEVLGTTRQTISRWTRDGKLSHEKFGREVLVPKWEVERLQYQQVFE